MAKDPTRSIILVIGLLLFVALGGIGFLLDHLYRSPGLKSKVRELKEQVSCLERQLGLLEKSIDELEEQNDRFSVLNAGLNGTVAELSQLNSDFSELNKMLNQSNDRLSINNAELASNIATLEGHNKELRSIVGFINATSADFGQSVNKFTEFLDDGIQFYQASSLRSLELDYLMLIRNWDCDYRFHFLGEEFAANSIIAIGKENYPLVQSYIKERLFDEMCLDTSDWEQFMEADILKGPLEGMTTNNLIRGVRIYTRRALEYYFPDGGEVDAEGPSWHDWSRSDYQCDGLERTFRWM